MLKFMKMRTDAANHYDRTHSVEAQAELHWANKQLKCAAKNAINDWYQHIYQDIGRGDPFQIWSTIRAIRTCGHHTPPKQGKL